MAVQLPPHLEAKIERLVATGQYADASDVIAQALRLLEDHDRRLQELRAILAVGEEQEERGEVVELTPALWDDIVQTALEKARAGHVPHPDVCT